MFVNGKKETIQKFEYDDLGGIRSVARGGNAGLVSYDYNIHGWTTNIDSREFHEEIELGCQEDLRGEPVLYCFSVLTLKFYYMVIQNKYTCEYSYDEEAM